MDYPKTGDVRISVHPGGQRFKQVFRVCLRCGQGTWVTPQKHGLIDQMDKSCSRRYYMEEHPEYAIALSTTMKEVCKTPEMRAVKRKAWKVRFDRPHERERASERQKQCHRNDPGLAKRSGRALSARLSQPEAKEKMRLALIKRHKEYPLTAEAKSQIKASNKKHWLELDPEQKDRRVRQSMKAANIRPNKPEIVIQTMLDALYPHQWKYTGDGSFIIGGLNPDFVNVNGKKKLIELFGTYWHAREGQDWKRSELGRMMVFRSYGWETLIIWEYELKQPEEVVARIKGFYSMKVKHH